VTAVGGAGADGTGPLARTQGTVFLLRHGETEWNRARRVMGHHPIPLSPTGIAQSEAAVELLRSARIDRIVTSPLARARETAEIVAAGLGLPLAEDADLVGTPAYEAYAADPLRVAPPQGETLVIVQRRGLGAIARALGDGGAGRVLLVSHGDLIRSVLCHLLALELTQFRRLRIDNCSLSAAELAGEWAQVKFVNVLADPPRVWESREWVRKIS
jgi:uncharacterized phosphatase